MSAGKPARQHWTPPTITHSCPYQGAGTCPTESAKGGGSIKGLSTR